jgi:MFS family permease
MSDIFSKSICKNDKISTIKKRTYKDIKNKSLPNSMGLSGLIQIITDYSILCILSGKQAERLCSNCLMVLIKPYMQEEFKFSESTTNAITSAFLALIWLSPLVGAWLADSFYGKFKIAVVGLCIYSLCLFIMTLSAINHSW